MKLNFTMSELIYSNEATKNKINNVPDIDSMDNMLLLIASVLQPIRNAIKKPMIITSGYRCPKLNKIVGGKPNSQHLKGQAVDFVIKGLEPDYIVKFIQGMGIEFDQLINEYDAWVHISYAKGKNRKKILKY
jgi:uncharacterized protein YcbK (DUF882 family)